MLSNMNAECVIRTDLYHKQDLARKEGFISGKLKSIPSHLKILNAATVNC